MNKEYILEINNKNLPVIYEVLSDFNWYYGKQLRNSVNKKVKSMYSNYKNLDPKIAFMERVLLSINDLHVFRLAANTYYQTKIRPQLDTLFSANSIDPNDYRNLKQKMRKKHQILVDTIFQLLINN